MEIIKPYFSTDLFCENGVGNIKKKRKKIMLVAFH